MFRSMTSDATALSIGEAKGHQAMSTFPSSPSKIPCDVLSTNETREVWQEKIAN